MASYLQMKATQRHLTNGRKLCIGHKIHSAHVNNGRHIRIQSAKTMHDNFNKLCFELNFTVLEMLVIPQWALQYVLH